MKQSKRILLVILILFLSTGCKATPVKQDEPRTSISTPSSAQDTSCRQTIQKLYSIESYCPNDLMALQQLFTDDFNQQYKPTLDRCNDVSNYSIIKLLSPSDNNFPTDTNSANIPDSLIYYTEVEIESKSGMALDNNPSSAWIYMKVDKLGQCKIDKITGGG